MQVAILVGSSYAYEYARGQAALKILEYAVGLHAWGVPYVPVKQYLGELKAEQALLHATTPPCALLTWSPTGHIVFRSLMHPAGAHCPDAPLKGTIEIARL